MQKNVEFKTVDFKTIEKIAIIGPSGAGKTTLAKKLGGILGLKVFHLDRYFWQPDWTRKPNKERIDLLERFVENKYWIIEGIYINSSEVSLRKADAIIFLNISPFVCLWRRIKRHCEFKGRPRRDIPKGSSDNLTFLGILKILFFPLGTKRKLKYQLSKFPKKVIQLHSAKEVERFLAQLEIYSSEKRLVVPPTIKPKA